MASKDDPDVIVLGPGDGDFVELVRWLRDEGLVTPGVGIGPLKLGMSIAAAAELVGRPNRAALFDEPAVPNGRPYVRPGRQIAAEANDRGTIYYIGTTNPAAAAPNGLGYGSTLDTVQSRLGVPGRSLPVGHSVRLVYDNPGAQFSISMIVGTNFYQRVRAIGVFPPRRP